MAEEPIFMGMKMSDVLEHLYYRVAEVHHTKIREATIALLGPAGLNHMPNMKKSWEEMSDTERRAVFPRIEHIVDTTLLEFIRLQSELAKKAAEEGEARDH